MTRSRLVRRSLAFYWRTHALAALCVALAAAVVVASFAVDAAVKASLRSRTVRGLGSIVSALATDGAFRSSIERPGEAAVWSLRGSLEEVPQGAVLGVAPSFSEAWGSKLPPIAPGDALISRSLARLAQVKPGDRLFVRLASPSTAPLRTVFGRRRTDDAMMEVAVRIAAIVPDDGPASFSLKPSFDAPRTVFVDRDWLANRLNRKGQANVLLSRSSRIDTEWLNLDDLGITLTRARSAGGWIATSRSVVMTPTLVAALQRAAPSRRTSLFLTEQIGSTPYATAAWVEGADPGALGAFTAEDIRAKPSQTVRLTALQPTSNGGLKRVALNETVRRIVPQEGLIAEPALAPALEGMTDADRLDDWHPPFDIDLSRIRPRDETYWQRFRAAPRILVTESAARQAWNGDWITGVWYPGPVTGAALRSALKPEECGIIVLPLRALAEEAAQGSSDLGGLLLGLGAFVVAGALALAATVLSLAVQSRARETLLLERLGIGFRPLSVEGPIVACLGSLAGIPLGYGAAVAVVAWLRRLMPPETGLDRVTVGFDSSAAVAGFAASFLVAWFALAWSLRRRRTTTRRTRLISWGVAGVLAVLAITLRDPGYRGILAAAATLFALLAVIGLVADQRRSVEGLPSLAWRTMDRRAFRLAVFLSGMSSLVLLIVAAHLRSVFPPAGPYDLVATTTHPVAIDWSQPEGRRRLGFQDESPYEGATILPLLRTDGDDASCLNLARPTTPRIVAAPASLIAALKLQPPWGTAPLPLIGDEETVRWVLHSDIGGELAFGGRKGAIVELARLRFLAGDLLTSESAFRRAFPTIESPTVFLIRTAPAQRADLATALRHDLAPYGVEVRSVAEIEASFGQVQRSYLAIFLAFGLFASLLTVVGLGLLSLRSAVDRRRSFAVLLALGFQRRYLGAMTVLESLLGVAVGLVAGGLSAIVGSLAGGAFAIEPVPALISAAGVLTTAAATSIWVARRFLRDRLVEALRTE